MSSPNMYPNVNATAPPPEYSDNQPSWTKTQTGIQINTSPQMSRHETLFPNEDLESQRLLHHDHNPSGRRCNYHEDWDEHEHSHNESKICWAMILGIIGVVLFWPLCIIGYYMMIPVKRSVTYYHRHWCKTNSVYYLNLIGMIWGIIETIVLIALVIERNKL